MKFLKKLFSNTKKQVENTKEDNREAVKKATVVILKQYGKTFENLARYDKDPDYYSALSK